MASNSFRQLGPQDECRFRSQRGKNSGDLDRDVATTDNRDPPRPILELEKSVGGDPELRAGNSGNERPAARRNQDVFSVEPAVRRMHCMSVQKAPVPADQLDFVLREKALVDAVQAQDIGVPLSFISGQSCPSRVTRNPYSGASWSPAARSAAFHITFLGTQPTFTQAPPSRPDSTRATRAPYSAARLAAARPPLPPPITTRSYWSDISPKTSNSAFRPSWYMGTWGAELHRMGSSHGTRHPWKILCWGMSLSRLSR